MTEGSYHLGLRSETGHRPQLRRVVICQRQGSRELSLRVDGCRQGRLFEACCSDSRCVSPLAARERGCDDKGKEAPVMVADPAVAAAIAAC